MHDIRLIRDDPEAFDAALMRRSTDFAGTAARLLALDEERRALIGEVQALQERRNAASKEIGQAKKDRDEARAAALMAEVAAIKENMPARDARLKEVEKALHDDLAAIPNLPLASVPDGADEHGNVERHAHGAKPDLAFAPRQHFEIGEALGQMDFETAAKLSGARFVVTRGPLARLERALGHFMLDTHVNEHGYLEVNPPLLVRDEAMFGTAQLPKFHDDQFAAFPEPTLRDKLDVTLKQNSQFLLQYVDDHGLQKAKSLAPQRPSLIPDPGRYWLIPTAEVPLTNLVRESIVAEEELPLRFTALTPCFRAEAGAAGRDTRGMIRQHQFSKVELVSVTTPEQSGEEHERMLASAEAILKKLGLHYRVMTLCAGDMGFASQKTFDIEVWLPGQGAYREISSCSVCGDFQARRMNARYRADGAPRFVHTLNGSGVAVGRALVAVLENYQNADGSVTVPDVLRPYMGGVEKVEPLARKG